MADDNNKLRDLLRSELVPVIARLDRIEAQLASVRDITHAITSIQREQETLRADLKAFHARFEAPHLTTSVIGDHHKRDRRVT
jgi:hypothetical protein